MGASLAGTMLTTYASHLGKSHAARVAMVVMALTAKDGDAHPVYFGGTVPIARALGLGEPEDRPGYRDPQPTRTQQNQVSAALRELKRVGAITVVDKPRPNRRGKYELHPLIPAVDNPAPKRPKEPTSRGNAHGSDKRTLTVPTSNTLTVPASDSLARTERDACENREPRNHRGTTTGAIEEREKDDPSSLPGDYRASVRPVDDEQDPFDDRRVAALPTLRGLTERNAS